MSTATDKITPRISGGLSTVKGWDEDPSLLAETRRLIPFSVLLPEWYARFGAGRRRPPSSSAPSSSSDGSAGDNDAEGDPETTPSPYAHHDDHKYDGDDLLLKRLTWWFQKEGMSWCNNPPCDVCGCKDTSSVGMRGPQTPEEIEGGAGRVELYHCPTCDAQTTTFPRYNSPRKLLETRRGRCGEYANLFGLFCRAAGFETRYVSDFTDHVWVECWSVRQQRWIHADSCEGTIDAASMYEHGWGKKLNYILAFTAESVVDVTRRYTRKFGTDEFQKRRREICGSEAHGEMILAQVNASLRAATNWARGQEEELDRRLRAEREFFKAAQRAGSWESGAYSEGRVSGSLAWRAARHELGPGGSEQNSSTSGEGGDDKNASSECFLVESFHPAPFRSLGVSITVSTRSESVVVSPRECITVSQVPCAVGLPTTASIVTIDEKSGCILQSRSFSNWTIASSFLHAVRDGRIVAISSDCLDGIADAKVLEKLSRFGGLCPSLKGVDNEEESILFIGQANYHPKWAILKCTRSPMRLTAIVSLSESDVPLKLRTEPSAIPSIVSARLPERIMPLRTQMLASSAQKRQAFQKFMEEQNDDRDEAKKECYVGYATKAETPIYLVARSGFPLQVSGSGVGTDNSKDDQWKTYHYLPEPLVPDKDGADDSKELSNMPKYDVPVDTGFFVQLFGQNLLKKVGGVATQIDTAACLNNTRLVALYFSAHWCPPCRRFTPLLIEFYEHMKEELPTHGLEIVFVSSDRDPGSFNQYYGSMPWLALPFENRFMQQSISGRYGVRGIPAFVVLDSVSGQVVVTADQSRSEVMKACQGGDSAISDLVTNSWLKRVPPETQSILESLALSMQEEEDDGGDNEEHSYLVRSAEEQAKDPISKPSKEQKDPSERIKEIFGKLVGEGMAPNAAAAKAIQLVAQDQKDDAGANIVLEPGPLSESGNVTILEDLSSDEADSPVGALVKRVSELNGDDSAAVKTVISTAKKYLQNIEKSPSTPKFRSFKMSNKVFDRITGTPGGINLLLSLGFSVYATESDFMACVPLAADLKAMQESMDDILKEIEN